MRNVPSRQSTGFVADLIGIVIVSVYSCGGMGPNPYWAMFLNRCAIWASSRCNCGWVAQAARHGDTIDVSGAVSHRSMQCIAPAPAKTNNAITDSRLRAAHRVCPYSNATRGNVDVSLTANGRAVDDAAKAADCRSLSQRSCSSSRAGTAPRS